MVDEWNSFIDDFFVSILTVMGGDVFKSAYTSLSVCFSASDQSAISEAGMADYYAVVIWHFSCWKECDYLILVVPDDQGAVFEPVAMVIDEFSCMQKSGII